MPIFNLNDMISNPGSERAILSIIFHKNEKLLECEEKGLFAEHFAVKGHKYIYSAMAYLFSNPDINRIDSLVIYNTITDPEAKASIDTLGGMMYLDTIFDSRPADNIKLYIRQVRNCALKRLAYAMGDEIKTIAMEDLTTDELLDKIQRRTLDLVLDNESSSEIYQMGASGEERLRLRATNPREIPGYSMGWEEYDKVTQGQKPNELTIIVAESKTGKSTLLLNMAHKFSIVDGIPGLYIDSEMTSEEQEDRLLSLASGVPHEEIVNGMFSRNTVYGTAEEKTRALFAANDRIKASKLYHVYMPSFTIEKVTALVRKHKIQNNIGFAIFDYIKLPTSELAGLANAQEYQRLGFITTCLKDLAGICQIPVISAAQSNRTAVGNTQLDASSIGGSYRILQMATRLMFLRNKTEYEIANEGYGSGNQKLKVAYQRNGKSSGSGNDEINIRFDKPILKMGEV